MMVGAGGSAGSQSKGVNGGDSWFINNTTILAYGGTGGNSGGNVALGLGGITGVGGVIMLKGGNGGKDYSQSTNGSGGGGGGSAGPGGNGKNGVNAANGVTNAKGGTMVSGGGAGGDGCGQGGALLPDCAGSAGTAPGGGGGGGNDDGNSGKGGAGAKGKVVLTYKIIPLALSVNNGYICVGTSATLTASGATTYTWTPSTGLSATNGASVTANPASSTTYTVTGTTAGCTNSTTSVVTFTACCTQATIGLTSATGTNAQTLCHNTAINPITYSVGGGGTNATVAGLPTGITGVFASGTLTINGTSTQVGVFNYTVTTSGGCGPEVASGSITINDLPIITSNFATICQGQSAILTASGSGGGVSYVWQPGASTNASFTTPILSSSTSYTVTGKDVNGCNNTSVSDVTVTPSLIITVLGNSSVCIGASKMLSALGANTYTWAPSNFLTATTGATTTTTPTITTTYTVTGAANGCTGFTVVTIPVTPPDDASFSYSGVTFCNVTGTYTPTVTVGGTFSITPPGALSLNTATGEISVDASTALGAYDIIHTTTAGSCSNTYTLTVTIVGIPDATFSYAGPYCKTATVNPKITQLLGATPGVFSASPAGLFFVNTSSGEINLAGSTANSYTVTNTIAAGGGCSLAKDSAVVTITPSPITSVTSATICAGTTATITASGASSYIWVGGGTPSGTGNQNLTHNPASTQTYTVTGTTSGCVSSATGTITVTQAPVVGIILPPASVCPGTPATLTATGATTYTWVGGGTPSGSKLTDNPISTTNYTVTGAIGICTATAIGKITVGSAPSILTADATICSGSTGATLTANGGSTYSWSTIPPQTTSSINVNPTVTTTYTVTGTGLTVGCNGVAYATVYVNATPFSTISAVAGTICFGQSSILTVSTVGAASYAWSSGGSGNSITVSPTTITPYTVTVTSTAGCSATASKTVIVNPLPVVGVNSVTICSGQTASLIATGAKTYAWLPNIGSTATVTTPALTTTTSYSVTGTTVGCSGTVVSKVVVITTPTVTVTSASICAGLPARLTANGASTYIWMPGGASGSSITVNPNVTTSYTVKGTSATNCSSTAVGTVTAFLQPTAAFDDLSTINLSNAKIAFVDKSTNAASWTWNFGDAVTSIEQNPQHTYADTGKFVIGLRVVSNGGCVDSIFHDVRIIPDLLIYIPNAFTPDENGVNDGFSFKSSGLTANGFEFRIFNRWGEQLFYTTDITAAWKGDDTKGTACPQDIYVYSIIIKDGFGKEKKYLGNITLIR
jgi:gliding motility-associated-like protein